MNPKVTIILTLLLSLIKIHTGSFKPKRGDLSSSDQFQDTIISSGTTSDPGYVNETSSPNHLGRSETEFSKLLRRGIFVDKTLLLEGIFDQKLEECLAINAPKKFGKSVNMQMIKTFCEIEMSSNTGLPIARDLDNVTDTPNYHLFTKQYKFGKLKISQKSEFMREHFGKYPVIFISFKTCLSPIRNSSDAEDCLRKLIRDAFKSHEYLTKSTKLYPDEKKYCKRWCDDNYRNQSSLKEYRPTALGTLMHCLTSHFKRRVMLLVDDYDWIVQSSIVNADGLKDRCMEHIFETIQTLFLLNLKGRYYHQRAVLMGTINICLQVSIYTLNYYAFGRDEKFSKYFGFTSEEVDDLFHRRKFRLAVSTRNRVKNYYNGYSADGVDIYSPYSIVRYLEEKKFRVFFSEHQKPTAYVHRILRSPAVNKVIWDLTNNNKTLEIKDDDGKQWGNHLVLVLQGEVGSTWDIYMKNQKCYIDIVANYLLSLGYLKLTSISQTGVKVDIPNLEVREHLLNSMNACRSLTTDDGDRRKKPISKPRYERYDNNENVELEGDDEEDDPFTYDEKDDKWIKEAVLAVAYYLRSQKFNGYDVRIFNETKPAAEKSNFYGKFAEPALKYFHFEAFESCKDDFISCLRYLYETVLDAYLQRSIDTVYVMRKNNWTYADNTSEIDAIDENCRNMRFLDHNHTDPFDNLIQKFQWTMTAGYYMCLYTLQEKPELMHFGEPCDNFAYCLPDDKTTNNRDIRANDLVPFQCAMYSFCPDPCCANKKLVLSADSCQTETDGNPCHRLNNRKCSFNKTLNRSFISIVYNEWNVSCVCPKDGYGWNSRYGLCVDYNECEQHNPCDNRTEECVNIEGKFMCHCKFNLKWSEEEKKCVEDEILVRAEKRFGGIDVDVGRREKPNNLIYWVLAGGVILIKYNFFFG